MKASKKTKILTGLLLRVPDRNAITSHISMSLKRNVGKLSYIEHNKGGKVESR